MKRIDKQQLLAMQRKYRTDSAIGRFYGISRQMVHKLRKSYGIEAYSIDREARDREICTLFDAGVSIDELEDRFSLSQSYLRKIISGRGDENVFSSTSALKKALLRSKSVVMLFAPFDMVDIDIAMRLSDIPKPVGARVVAVTPKSSLQREIVLLSLKKIDYVLFDNRSFPDIVEELSPDYHFDLSKK